MENNQATKNEDTQLSVQIDAHRWFGDVQTLLKEHNRPFVDEVYEFFDHGFTVTAHFFTQVPGAVPEAVVLDVRRCSSEKIQVQVSYRTPGSSCVTLLSKEIAGDIRDFNQALFALSPKSVVQKVV